MGKGRATAKADPYGKRVGENDLQWRSRIAKLEQDERDRSEPLVTPFAQSNGRYRQQTVMHVETNTRVETYRNIELPRIIEQWHAEGRVGFELPAMDAMRRCIALWDSRPLIGSLSAAYSPAIKSGANDYDRHVIRALDDTREIDRYKGLFHPAHWRVFERIVRFNLPIGSAGEEIEANGPQSTASARSIVGLIANAIALQPHGA